MKICVVSLFTPEIADYALRIAHDKSDYCAIHGYDFICPTQRISDGSRPASWDKILLLQKHLPEYDYLFWTDADSIIMDFSIRLERFIDAYSELIISKDHNAVNAGNFFIRNTPRVHEFLKDVYAQTDLINHCWWDNAAIIRLLDQNPPPLTVNYIPQVAINSYPHLYVPGDFILHFPGLKNLTDIVSACGTTDLVIPTRQHFPTMFRKLGLLKRGAEIGVQAGDFAASIAARWPGEELFLVDQWKFDPMYTDISNVPGDQQELLYKSVLNRFSMDDRVTVIRGESTAAASRFSDGHLDWVYIDANHRYEFVLNDLHTWYPKVRRGGMLAGHDYLDGELPEGVFGVKRAVHEFCKTKSVCIRQTKEPEWPSWYIVKREQ